MRHSGCPVLVGNKWVANKWLHEFGQEFKRPCGTNYTNSDHMKKAEPEIEMYLNDIKKSN